MNVTTAFEINDIVRHKYGGKFTYRHGSAENIRYEIIYIHVETCSAGSQIFYTCRPLFINRDKDYASDEVKTSIRCADNTQLKDIRFREDEVSPCDTATLADIMSCKEAE